MTHETFHKLKPNTGKKIRFYHRKKGRNIPKTYTHAEYKHKFLDKYIININGEIKEIPIDEMYIYEEIHCPTKVVDKRLVNGLEIIFY